jgi:hypothetical protein
MTLPDYVGGFDASEMKSVLDIMETRLTLVGHVPRSL